MAEVERAPPRRRSRSRCSHPRRRRPPPYPPSERLRARRGGRSARGSPSAGLFGRRPLPNVRRHRPESRAQARSAAARRARARTRRRSPVPAGDTLSGTYAEGTEGDRLRCRRGRRQLRCCDGDSCGSSRQRQLLFRRGRRPPWPAGRSTTALIAPPTATAAWPSPPAPWLTGTRCPVPPKPPPLPAPHGSRAAATHSGTPPR